MENKDIIVTKKPLWRRALKIGAWCVGSLAGLLLLLMVSITIFLTPERLGALVTKYSGEFVDADLKIESIDYSIWSSFPYVGLSVERATVVSHALRDLPPQMRDSIPSDCDTLGSFRSLRASMNPWPLILGKISVRDVALDGLALNLVAVNDSVANYFISKSEEEEEESPVSVPHFSVRELKVTNTKYIKYFSAATKASALLNLNTLTLNDTDTSNEYDLTIKGDAGFQVERLTVLDKFPFGFNGKLAFDFDPFLITFKQYGIDLGNMKTRMDLAMEISDDSQLKSFNYDVSPFTLMKLFQYLPAGLLPDLTGVKSDMQVQASLRLTAPYKFSAETLPSFDLKFSVPDSYVSYTLAGVGTYHIHNIGMSATLEFDGAHPEKSVFTIPAFTLAGDGVTLDISGSATNLLKSPDVKACVVGNADFGEVSRYVAALNGMTLRGLLTCDVDMLFNLDELMAEKYNKMEINGTASMRALTFKYPDAQLAVESRNAEFNFGNNVKQLGNFVSNKGMLAFSADVDTMRVVMPGYDAAVGGARLLGGTTPAMLQRTDTNEIIPMGLAFIANSVRAVSDADSSKISSRNLKLSGSVERYQNKKSSPLFRAALSADRVAYRDPTMFARLRNLDANLQVHLNPARKKTASRYQARYDSIAKANPNLDADSIAVLARRHRRFNDNEVVSMDLDKGFRDLIKQWNVSGSVKARGGVFATYYYPTKNRLENLNMDFSFDSIALHSLTLKSQSNIFNLTGKITNLRQMMMGSKRTPVKIRLNAVADTINVNQIASTYEKGELLQKKLVAEGKIIPESEEDLERLAGSVEPKNDTDSLTVIVPRNVDAEISFLAKNVIYTDLNVYDISTRLMMQDGAFNIDNLQGHTDFGSAYLNLLYSTRDLNDIMMSLDVGFEKIDVNMFFNRFSQFKEMMPIMDNLSGFVSAKVAGSMRLLPNMDLDFPSVRAVLDVRGNDLKVHQDEMIRKVARLLFIGNHDINIKDMLVQVSIHDNLLELYPFIFEFDRYKLGLLGENDFDGNMYYHVSILKSPIPFRFGINIKGNFDKYKIRFGGAKYHSDQATRLIDLVDERRINLVQEMHQFVRKFIKKAALSDTGSPNLNMLNAPEEEEKLSAPIRVLLQNQDLLQKMLDSRKSDTSAATKK